MSRQTATPAIPSLRIPRGSPQAAAEQCERWARLPEGIEERFVGYGVIGLPFASGHILGLRRWPASSIGPAYTSVWHRDPAGVWRLYSDVPEVRSCSRYISAAVSETITGPIQLVWRDPWHLSVLASGLQWDLGFGTTVMTAAFGLCRRLGSDRIFGGDRALACLERLARWGLGTGPIRLRGLMPNGQQFRIVPRQVWVVRSSLAQLGAADFGSPSRLQTPARLGDFLVPDSGLLAFATARFW